MSFPEPSSTISSPNADAQVIVPNHSSPPVSEQIPHHQLSSIIEALEQSRLLTEAALRELRTLKQAPVAMAGSSAVFEQHALPLPVGPNEMGKIVEGVFSGQSMVAFDGVNYPIPPNYASKSKLVEGDRLKLTILPNGAFIFKQIAPVERDRRIGELERAEHGFQARVGERVYSILTASVTYYRGEGGDQITVLVPRGVESRWAAVENIIKRPAAAQPSPFQNSTPVQPEAQVVASNSSVPLASPGAADVSALDDILSDFRP